MSTATLLPDAMAACLAEDDRLVAAERLEPACRTKLWDVPNGAACRGVALLLHGFTAGPWQFAELGPKLAEAGLAAYAARLPGHGARAKDRPTTGGEDLDGLPTAAHAANFGASARQAYAEALALAHVRDVPLYLIGHSAGGAMALDLLRDPDTQVRRAVLVAPLLRPKWRPSYVLVQLLGKLPLLSRLTDRVALSWPAAPVRADGWIRPGHRHFRLGHVVALFGYAAQVRRLARAASRRQQLPPIQLICTVRDDKVDLRICRRLAATRPKRHHLLCFAKAARVPHAMLTQYEHPHAAHRDQVHGAARDFLLHGRGVDATVRE